MKPKINPLWGAITLVLVALTLALCVIGAQKGVILVKTSAEPRETVEIFFESLVIGKYEAAYACLENYSGLGLERSPRTQQGQQELAALLASFDYSLDGETQVAGGTAKQTVRLRALDLAALEEALETPLDPEAEEPAYPGLEELLAQPEQFYHTTELAVTLHYVDGQWLIAADSALLTALSGGKA